MGTHDAPTINAKIDIVVLTARGVVSPPVSSCAPIEVTTVHGEDFHGNSRVAKIEHGTVPCLHGEDGTPATCVFSIVAGQESGQWLESPGGNFAKTGQALALDGTPGGDYVVAAHVSDAAPAPCIEPTSMDTMGYIEAGTELAGTCAVEEMGQEWNAFSAYDGWAPLVNVTDLEICSSNNPSTNPHPDGAALVRSFPQPGSVADDTFCYTGSGAALNDLNGTERDFTTNYLSGERYCHVILSGGYEVPGAKRPATRSLPAPGSIRTNTPILWRPVSPNFNIANALPATPPTLRTFNDKATFLAATGAVDATGDLPDMGSVDSGITLGSVTFGLAPGGDGLYIGTGDTTAAPDWYPYTPGNDIALGYENLQVSFANPVYALGFDMVEPNTTMPAYGGTAVDSTYQVTLFNGTTQVGQFTFNTPDDVLAFVGVRSTIAFDRAWIIDVTKDAAGNPSPFIDDDEYFGRFYTSSTPPAD